MTAATDFDRLRLPTDRTLAFTWGRWGGFYKVGSKGWGGRICIGWVFVEEPEMVEEPEEVVA